MSLKLILTVDFGNDSTKVAYAFKKDNKPIIGKIIDNSSLLSIRIPSVARYTGSGWLFGDEVTKKYDGSYAIVKIKELLSMLIKPSGESKEIIFESNQRYFYKDKEFKKFYFPPKNLKYTSFDDYVRHDHTFRADITQKELCIKYFEYVKRLVDIELTRLSKKYNESFNVELCVVYPLYSGSLYSKELSEIIETAFKMKVTHKMDSTRGVCSMAYAFGAIKGNENVLVFEIGDEKISVVKAQVVIERKSPVIMVEGREGHQDPAFIGGNDFDFAIARDCKKRIGERISFGTSTKDDEELSITKQYLLANNIKKTKMLISSRKEVFDVSLQIPADVTLTEKYNGNQLMDILGIRNGNGVYQSVLGYIEKEINFVGNSNVTKVIISGGASETYGLFDKLKADIEKKYRKLTVDTIDIEKNPSIDVSNITTIDDATFAVACGASLAFLLEYRMDTVLSLSYGSYINYGMDRDEKFFEFYAEKGTKITKGEHTKGMYRFYLNAKKPVRVSARTPMPIYSTFLTQNEINRRYKNTSYEYKYVGSTVVLDISTRNLPKLKRDKVITLVAGDEYNSGYIISFRGSVVGEYELQRILKLRENEVVHFEILEYIAVTEDGRVFPGIEPLNLVILTPYGEHSYSFSGFEIKYNGVLPFELD